MLLNLLLGSLTILICFSSYFLLFLTVSLSFLWSKKIEEVNLALAIPTRTPTILAKAIIDTSPLAADKKTEVLST